MSLISRLLGEAEIRKLPAQQKSEVNNWIAKLVHIGKTDDFLSLIPGGPFNHQCHHKEARQIGEALNAIGGTVLMMAVRQTIRRKLNDVMAEHLDHCWKGIGEWQP